MTSGGTDITHLLVLEPNLYYALYKIKKKCIKLELKCFLDNETNNFILL